MSYDFWKLVIGIYYFCLKSKPVSPVIPRGIAGVQFKSFRDSFFFYFLSFFLFPNNRITRKHSLLFDSPDFE